MVRPALVGRGVRLRSAVSGDGVPGGAPGQRRAQSEGAGRPASRARASSTSSTAGGPSWFTAPWRCAYCTTPYVASSRNTTLASE